MSDDKLMPNKGKKLDEVRKQKLLQERQDRMLADLQKQASTPIIKDSSLSTDDIRHVKSKSAPIDTKQIEKLTSGSDFMEKIAKLRGLKALGQKVAGVVPLAGVGMAALSGDPAMAAEEAAGDLTGGIYDAIKSEDAGNPEEEKMMLAERQAMENYKNSPAYRNKRGISEEDADLEELQKPRKPSFSKLRGLFGE